MTKMGPTTSVGLKLSWLLLLLQIFKLGSSTVTYDADSTKAFKDVYAGSKHYAVFKVSKDLSTVSFVKASDGDFTDLTKDLVASKEALLAAYTASVTDETGQKTQELVVLVWVPTGLTDELGQKYALLVDEAEDALDVDVWLAVVTDSESDLNLEALLESASEGYNRIISTHVEYGATEVVVTVKVDVSLKQILSDLSLGSKRYVVFKFSDDFSTVVLDKVGDLSASFSNLVTDLEPYEASGQVRVVLYYLPVVEDGLVENRLLLILWAPSTADKTLVKKYLSKLKSLKSSLKLPVWTDVTVESTDELSVEGINDLLPAFIGRLQKPVVEVPVEPERLDEKEIVPEGEELDTDTDTDDDDDDDDDDLVKLDVSVETAVDDVSKGLKRYLLLKWSPDKKLLVDKSAGPKATFESLVADLTTAQKAGEGRYALYYDPDKGQLILIVWTPSDLPKAQIFLYRKGFKKLKKLLKKTFLVVVSRSVADLNLQLLFRRGIVFDFDFWLKRHAKKHGKGKGHHGKKVKGYLKNFLRGKHLHKGEGKKGGHGKHGYRFGERHRRGHGGFRGKHHKGGHGGFGLKGYGHGGGHGGFEGKGHGYGGGFEGKGYGKHGGGFGKLKGEGSDSSDDGGRKGGFGKFKGDGSDSDDEGHKGGRGGFEGKGGFYGQLKGDHGGYGGKGGHGGYGGKGGHGGYGGKGDQHGFGGKGGGYEGKHYGGGHGGHRH